MTAIAADRDIKRKDGDVIAYKVQAAEIIYKGTPVCTDASDGMLQSNDGTTLTLADGDVFQGISYEKCDNSAGADAAKECRVWKTGLFLLTFTDTLANDDIGKPVYINNTTDDAAVTFGAITDAAQVRIGTLERVESATQGWVRIDNFVGTAATTTAS